MASGFFALEFGEDTLKVGDFETKGDSLVTISTGISPIAHNLFVSETDDVTRSIEESIKKLLADSKISKKNVNIIIPDSQSYSRIIEMPLLTEKELVSAIRYQADQFIPIPIDKANVDVEVLSEDKVTKKILVLLVAASKSVVSKIVSVVENVGLYPEVLETQMSSSLRLFEYALTLSANKTTNHAQMKYVLFVNIGITSTSIYMFNAATFLPIASHIFPMGFEIFVKGVKSNLQIDEIQIRQLLETQGFDDVNSSTKLSETLNPVFNEYASQIVRYIMSLKEKFQINADSIYLFGDGSRIKGINTRIGQAVGITCSVFNIVPFMRPNPVVDYFKNDWPALIPIIGANLRQV